MGPEKGEEASYTYLTEAVKEGIQEEQGKPTT